MITGYTDRGTAQAERIRMWRDSEDAWYRAQRDALRAEWVSYHERLASNHRELAAEHEGTARRLLAEVEEVSNGKA